MNVNPNSYGRFYAKTFTGSMVGAGPTVFSVWGFAIANAMPPNGTVELNPRLLAPIIGTTPDEVSEAIKYLCSPDAQSRTPIEEGRRLIQTGAFQYRLTNFAAHRSGAMSDERREYLRVKQREHRANSKGKTHRQHGLNPVNRNTVDMSTLSTQPEPEPEPEPNISLKNVGQNAAAAAPASKGSETAWIESLKGNQAYRGIDVERELAKMVQWCAVNGKQPTKRRFINWLNRCDKPIASTARPGSSRSIGTANEGSANDYAIIGRLGESPSQTPTATAQPKPPTARPTAQPPATKPAVPHQPVNWADAYKAIEGE